MKTKSILVGMLLFLYAFAVSAQSVESDDMYFSSKDRQAVRAEKEKEKAKEKEAAIAYAKNVKKFNSDTDDTNGAVENYSSRNTNPEYTSRLNSEIAQSDNEDYFINDYQYSNSAYGTAARYNSWNNSYNDWYSNPWYNASWYGPSMYSYNSPYYGAYYNAYDPYFGGGYGSSFGYGWGSSWNSGWGSSFSMNFGYGNYSPYYNYYGGWGSRYWGNSYYYPGSTVVIINNGERAVGRNVVSGARGSRSNNGYRSNGTTSLMNATNRSESAVNSGRGRNDYNNGSTNENPDNGRVVTPSRQRQDDYYNRSYRNSQSTTTPSRNYNGGNTDNNRTAPSNDAGRQQQQRSSSFGNDNNNSRSGSYSSPSPSRSTGGGSSGSSGNSGGRSRGR
jgi:hypothetical protein